MSPFLFAFVGFYSFAFLFFVHSYGFICYFVFHGAHDLPVIVFASHTELDEEIVERQVALVYELLCQGELGLARLLRRKVLEKCEKKKAAQDQPPPVNPVQNIDLSSRSGTLRVIYLGWGWGY